MKQSSPRSSVFTLIPFYLSEKGRPSRTKHVSRELVPLKQPSMRGGLLPLETCFSQLQHSRHREVFYCLREPVSVGYNTADTERWFTASGNLFQSVTTQPTPRGVLLPQETCFSQPQHSRHREVFYCLLEPVSISHNTAEIYRYTKSPNVLSLTTEFPAVHPTPFQR